MRYLGQAISIIVMIGVLAGPDEARSQLDEGCTVSVLNQTARVNPDGTWLLPNVPADQGLLRAVVTCETADGEALTGQSGFFVPQADDSTTVGPFLFEDESRVPTAVGIAADTFFLTAAGETAQIFVVGLLPNGGTVDLTSPRNGTTYVSSNPSVATVSQDPPGVVTAVSSGTATISAFVEGMLASAPFTVNFGEDENDSDGDGMTDAFENANGLDPNDPTDAEKDADGDDLTNLDEFNLGTLPQVSDTDGDGLDDFEDRLRTPFGELSPVNPDSDFDGLLDGDEVLIWLSNPLLRDSDGDGLIDGLEVRIGLSPTDDDSDDDGITDDLEDTDGDRLVNRDELALLTDPGNVDTDGDGAPDGLEVISGCDPLEPETTTVSGRVIDTQGDPVEGASVQVVGRKGDPGVTDSQGMFALSDIPACPVSLRVSALAGPNSPMERGRSPATGAVISGETDVGDIIVRPFAGPLYPAPRLPVGDGPLSVAGGDLNGDGFQDLVTANNGTADISILLGNGDGTYQGEQSLDGASNVFDLAVTDLNADGAMDLVSIGSSTVVNLAVHLGNGDGTFSTDLLSVAGSPNALTLGDVNSDEVIDAVIANETFADPNTNEILVLLGNGDGTFQDPQVLTVDGLPSAVALGEVDGDPFADLVTADETTNEVSLFSGNDDGTFDPIGTFPVGDAPVSLSLADMDLDGPLDIVAANRDSNDVSVLLGIGDGTFLPAQSFPAGVPNTTASQQPSIPNAVAVVDLDSDGLPDVVTANSGDGDDVSILPGNGDGTLQSAQDFPAGEDPTYVSVIDANGDALPDLATAGGQSNDVTILLGTDADTLQAARVSPVGSTPQDTVLLDLNRDGALDLVTANQGSGDVSLLLGNNDGTLRPQQRFDVSDTGASPKTLAVGDLDADGIFDVVTGNLSEPGVSVLIGKGGALELRHVLSLASSAPISAIALSDLDDSGELDLVAISSQNDTASVLLGVGDGNFLPLGDFAVGAGPSSAALGRLDADDFDDLVTASMSTDEISVLFGNGDGTFQPAQTLTVGGSVLDMTIADLDNDGSMDIITAIGGFRKVSALFGNGDGTFQPEQEFPIATIPNTVEVADLNQDGALDILTGNQGTNDVSVLLGNGDRTFQPEQGFTTGGFPLSLAVGDLNRDGAPDVVATNSSSTSVSVLMSLLVAPVAEDTDQDGLPNPYESANGLDPNDATDAAQDPDGDNLTTLEEFELGTNPFDPDTDGDGLSDGDEIAAGTNPLRADSDLDGLSDGEEIGLGTDPLNPDTDGDGLSDGQEVALGLDPLNGGDAGADSDGDGLSNEDELLLGTDFLNPDTDGDGLSDGLEVAAGLDPLDTTDAGADGDGDGLSNGDELAAGTDLANPDTDGDGLEDGEEVIVLGTNPLLSDTDSDGLSDGLEANTLGTDPLLADTDGDGLSDGAEVTALGTDPLLADTDSDGLSDNEEVNTHGTNPLITDTDGDGLSDGEEVIALGTDPLLQDGDADGLRDDEEINVHGTNPIAFDTDLGGRADGEEVLHHETDPLDGSDDLPAGSALADLYDGFGDPRINRTKWENLERVRRVENGALTSTLAAFGFDDSNLLGLLDPSAVNEMEADVAVSAIDNVGALPLAGLFGAFYNTGSATPPGATDDVIAGVGIGHDGIGLTGSFFVGQCEDSDCESLDLLVFDDTTLGPVLPGDTHQFLLGWDGANFSFGMDGAITAFDPAGAAPILGPPGLPFRGVGTLIGQIAGPEDGAFLSSTIDNVVADGLLYDDFGAGAIDPANWDRAELVRRVEGGAFESALAAAGLDDLNTLEFVDPVRVNHVIFDVAVTDVINAGATPFAGFFGAFYNSDVTGSALGATDDILAGVGISHDGIELVGTAFVARCEDPECQAASFLLFDDVSFGPVPMSEIRNTSIAWDGSLFSFGFDGTVVDFDPTGAAPVHGPPGEPFKGLATLVNGTTGPGTGAFIDAAFDDVIVPGLNSVSVHGQVLDADSGLPIQGAEVSTSLDGETTATEGTGHFFLQTGTPALFCCTEYTITVTAAGCQPFNQTQLFGDHPRNLDVDLTCP